MAITGHWMSRNANGKLELRSILLVFRHVEGNHTGKHLAQVFFEILRNGDLLYKVQSLRARLFLMRIPFLKHFPESADWTNHIG